MLAAGLMAATPAIGIADAPRSAGDRPAGVTNLRRISRDLVHGRPPSQDDTQVEPALAVDSVNAWHEVSAFQDGRYPDGAAAAAGFATTFDGGRSWTTGVFPSLTWVAGGRFERSGDQVMTFGPDGTVYAIMTAFNGQIEPTRRTAIVLFRSFDGGLSWDGPIPVQEDRDWSVFNDNPSIAVDSGSETPRFGRVYVTWIRERLKPRLGIRSPIVIAHSDDGGTSWSESVEVSHHTTNNEGAHPLVQRDGSVTVVWQRLHGRRSAVVASTSRNGTRSFGPTVEVAQDRWVESPGMRSGFGLPSSAIDPVTGDIYVAWQDGRFRTDGLNDALISRSADGGRSWSAPARVNQGPLDDRTDHLTPVLAAASHVVAVCYRTRSMVGPGTSNIVEERCISSLDDGSTFARETRLGPASDIDYASTVLPPHTKFLGDYSGVTVSSGAIHAAWAQSSATGGPVAPHQTIWSGTILL